MSGADSSSNANRAKSWRILIVEDDALIAMMAEDIVESLGCTVAGVAATVAAAMAALGSTDFDVALLDVDLNGETSMGVANALVAQGKRFIFTTGYGAGGIAPQHRAAAVLGKPYAIADLERALAACTAAN